MDLSWAKSPDVSSEVLVFSLITCACVTCLSYLFLLVFISPNSDHLPTLYHQSMPHNSPNNNNNNRRYNAPSSFTRHAHSSDTSSPLTSTHFHRSNFVALNLPARCLRRVFTAAKATLVWLRCCQVRLLTSMVAVLILVIVLV